MSEPAEHPTEGVDVRGVPANACPLCGSRVLYVKAIFEDYDLAAWFMDASCAECGALLTAPCPPDRPNDYFPEDAADGYDSDGSDDSADGNDSGLDTAPFG